MNHARSSLCLMAFLLCMSCTSPAKKQSATTFEAQAQQVSMRKQPSFSGDSALRFAQAQTSFGPRTPNSAAHEACKSFLLASLKRFGVLVTEQTFTVRAWDGNDLHATNIIASIFPEKKERILLCAHWDSRPWADQDPDPANHRKPVTGANDGASGVGVLLEIARILGGLSETEAPAVGIDLVLFDVEDYGHPTWFEDEKREDSWCLGSQHWSRAVSGSRYRARYGILVDMVGDHNPTFYMESYSLKFAPSVVSNVWNKARSLGYGNLFLLKEGGYITDDHLPVNQIAGIPCINIVDFDPDRPTGFPKYWHTMQDTNDNLYAGTLRAVGETLIHVIFAE